MAEKIFVTGATGTVGAACAAALERAGFDVLRGSRRPIERSDESNWIQHGELCHADDWVLHLNGCTTVVHCAGLAHLRNNQFSAEQGRLVNTEGTAALARASIAAGVSRFIFISSLLVHGDQSDADCALIESATPRPQSAYARSKFDAEAQLKTVAQSRMDWTILRPPMIYGPSIKGNFPRLAKLVATRVPLPLGRATAPKSFLSIDNLASAVTTLTTHPAASNQVFLLSDDRVSSTADLIRLIAAALGTRAKLFNVPRELLRAAATVVGLNQDVDRMFKPLHVSNEKIRNLVRWTPPLSMEDAIRRALADTSLS
ncbi:MAG: NAD-dependent epimerase/dehydratase family protein [Hyphomicrobiaceae bacterium]